MDMLILVVLLIGVNLSAVLVVAGWCATCQPRQTPTQQPAVIYVLSEDGEIIEEADGRWLPE